MWNDTQVEKRRMNVQIICDPMEIGYRRYDDNTKEVVWWVIVPLNLIFKSINLRNDNNFGLLGATIVVNYERSVGN